MLGPNDLVLCTGTLLQASLREMVEGACAGGFRGISLWPEDVERANAAGLSNSDIRTLLADPLMEASFSVVKLRAIA